MQRLRERSEVSPILCNAPELLPPAPGADTDNDFHQDEQPQHRVGQAQPIRTPPQETRDEPVSIIARTVVGVVTARRGGMAHDSPSLGREQLDSSSPYMNQPGQRIGDHAHKNDYKEVFAHDNCKSDADAHPACGTVVNDVHHLPSANNK